MAVSDVEGRSFSRLRPIMQVLPHLSRVGESASRTSNRDAANGEQKLERPRMKYGRAPHARVEA